MPLLLMLLLFRKIPQQKMPFFVKPIARSICKKVEASFIAPRLNDVINLVEGHLGEQKWFAGDQCSAADMQMSFPLLALKEVMNLSSYPNITRWITMIRSEPAYQSAANRVGEFQAF